MYYDKDHRLHLSAIEARGGEIILQTPAQRAIFLAGIAAAVLFGMLMVALIA